MRFMPILIKGEKLAQDITRTNTGGPKKFSYSYEQARDRIVNDINEINGELEKNKELYLEDEIILNIRMSEGFIAKSYLPSLFSDKESMKFVGARIYNRRIEDNKEIKSKLYFVKCSKENIEWLMKDLDKDNFNKTEIKQLRSIEKIDILGSKEKALGFEEDLDSNEYDIEVVLHPLNNKFDEAIRKIDKFFIGEKEIRKYEDGPIFILGRVNKENLELMADYNFLRTIHPMREIILPKLRMAEGAALPKIPIRKENKITVGVFDGGANDRNSYFQGYVKNYDLSTMTPDIESLEHGNAVCSSVLFGALNKYKNEEVLKTPVCNVESFRVLPEKNIYIVIDNIEKVVLGRDDIDIFNISFGPRGPILDDQIDRFTYSLDKLALNNKVFCIAVGNDGEVMKPFNRIQAPSDSVNNIGVGAYSTYNGEIYRAGYSCVGAGREGGKIKPDILAFGGDERNLFHAINFNGDKRMLTAGTSFASPVVAGKLAELRNKSNIFDALIARTILLHSSKEITKKTEEEGLGIVLDDVNEIISCTEKKVTLLYQGYLLPKKSYKLPIPLPDVSKKANGTVSFSWTICTLTDVNIKDSDLYTNSCIEETFYPNSNIYKFNKKGEKAIKVDLEKEIGKKEELEALGYEMSRNPCSDSAKRKSEELRRAEYKWDTVSRKTKGKKTDSIRDPFLIISGLSRDEDDISKIRFCVALTVEAKKYEGNLYEEILEKYPVLMPVELEEEIEEQIEEQIE